jgi:hypothetical protein
VGGGTSIGWPRKRGDLTDIVMGEVTDLNDSIIFIRALQFEIISHLLLDVRAMALSP